MKYLLTKLLTLLLATIVGLIVASSAFGAATIVIFNNDAAGVGFNDPTAVAPVGGNPGTTLGQQRLNAFQEAANIWGATLTSGPTIVIRAQWAAQTCTATSGTLGSAGNTGNIWRDFAGSVPGFWYGNALANALRNTDGNGSSPEINATFNVNLGTPGCLETLHWYYGLDNNHGATGVDLVSVLLHEFGHGLGFQTFTSSSSGAQAGSPNGFPSIYDRFLFDNTASKTWAQMTTDAERQASAINTNNLVWNGPQVTSDVPSVLSSAGAPRLKVNSPAGIAGNYTVGTATFGPSLTSAGVTANVEQASPADGCSAIGGAVSGKIALIDRGPAVSPCAFTVKVKNAQNAGAVGVIIADNVSSSSPPAMGGSDVTITIPSVSITMALGNTIKAQLGSGVNATLLLDTSAFAGADQLGHALMFAPNPVSSGSSVSHWDSSASPNQLMEPNISQDLSHSVTTPQDLTFSLMRDIGWCSGCPQPPPPSPTPTPSPVANDNFVNAQVVSGCSGSVTGTNVGATKETGEPNHDPPDSDALSPSRSVWYQWQAPSSGSTTITTDGSSFDTLLAIYTGSSVGSLTQITFNDDVQLGVVTTSSVTFSATAGTTYRIAVDGWGGDTGSIKLNWSESGCVATPTVRLTATDFPVNENIGVGFVTVSAIREGDATAAASVKFATSDTASLNSTCSQVTGKASDRCDYATSVGTLSWAAGEAGTKTFNVPIINDALVEGTETFNITLSNPTGVSLGTSTATVTITDNDTSPSSSNPIDEVDVFITQQYIDFLGRMPDAGGFQNWHDTLAPCPNGGFGEPPTSNCDRLHVAGGFLQSQEFLDRAYWAFRFYMVSYNQPPTYAQFIPDMAQVGGPKSPTEEETAKVAFANAFVLQSSFTTKYPGLSGQALADALLQTAGLPPGSYNAGGQTNGQILRGIAESQAALDKFLTEGTVSIQYFAFLRRDPDTIGYQNNVATLNANPNNLRHMIFIFIYSTEYRGRFGTP